MREKQRVFRPIVRETETEQIEKQRESFRPTAREKQRRNQMEKQRESFRPIMIEKQRQNQIQKQRESFRPIVREKQRVKHRERVLDR